MYVVAYVVQENAVALRRRNMIFFTELVEAASEGSVFLFVETTHRMWLDVVRAAFRGVDTCGRNSGSLNISFPRVKVVDQSVNRRNILRLF